MRVPFLGGMQSSPGPHHAQNGEEDDDGQAGVCAVGTGVDVGVPLLIQLQHAEASDHVHEGGVCAGTGRELETPTGTPHATPARTAKSALECHEQVEGQHFTCP